MVLGRLLRWLMWFAVFLLVAWALIDLAASEQRPERPAQRPAEGPLFHVWASKYRDWERDNALFDSGGSYFYADARVNVAVLAILQTPGVLRLRDAVADATPDRATLFPGTAFEVVVAPTANTLTVILPELKQVSVVIEPGDAARIHQWLCRAMESRPFSIVEEVYKYAEQHSRTELKSFLEAYRHD